MTVETSCMTTWLSLIEINLYFCMSKRKKTDSPQEIPSPEKHPEIIPTFPPEEVELPAEPDFIPDEDPYETPPEEEPSPGERP
jgi:hypothetical protein